MPELKNLRSKHSIQSFVSPFLILPTSIYLCANVRPSNLSYCDGGMSEKDASH